MKKVIYISPKMENSIRITFAMLLLIIGGVIYLIFRSEGLFMFQWVNFLQMDSAIHCLREMSSPISIPYFIKYNLPDGLWISSYMITMDTIWRETSRIRKLVWCMSLPIIAIITEIMQLLNLLVGTYDFFDLLCYTIPTLAYLIQYGYGKTD